MTIEEKFWSKVQKTENCWNWTGYTSSGSYGVVFISRHKYERAHRTSWRLHFGEIPKGNGYHGTCVLHKCDNRRCVRPDHLFLGSNADNVKDRMQKGRNGTTRGEVCHLSKLSEVDVLEIRRLLKIGKFSRTEIAKQFNVAVGTVCCIEKRKTWKHLP